MNRSTIDFFMGLFGTGWGGASVAGQQDEKRTQSQVVVVKEENEKEGKEPQRGLKKLPNTISEKEDCSVSLKRLMTLGSSPQCTHQQNRPQ